MSEFSLTINSINKWHCKKHNKTYDIQYPDWSPGISLMDKDEELFHFGLCCLAEFFKNNMEPMVSIKKSRKSKETK